MFEDVDPECIFIESLRQTRPEGLRSWPTEKQKVNEKFPEKCQICQGKSPKKFRKISHPELEISPYLSNFSKEVRQLTDW